MNIEDISSAIYQKIDKSYYRSPEDSESNISNIIIAYPRVYVFRFHNCTAKVLKFIDRCLEIDTNSLLMFHATDVECGVERCDLDGFAASSLLFKMKEHVWSPNEWVSLKWFLMLSPNIVGVVRDELIVYNARTCITKTWNNSNVHKCNIFFRKSEEICKTLQKCAYDVIDNDEHEKELNYAELLDDFFEMFDTGY